MNSWTLSLTLLLISSGPQAPVSPQDVFTPSELRSLNSAKNLPTKAKAYLNAAGRHLQAAQRQAKADNEPSLLESLEAYDFILGECRDDLAQVEDRKTKDYKRQEITLREYISELEDLEMRVNYTIQPSVQKAIEISKEVRSALLHRFFGRDSLKKP